MSTVRKQIVVDFISQTKASELHGFQHKVSTEILKDFKHNIDIISFAFYRNHSGTLWKLGIFFLIIEVQLIDNVVLVWAIQQSDCYTYSSFLGFFSHVDYYRILSRVPCAIRQVLVGYLFYTQYCVYVNLKFPSYPSSPPFPFENMFVFYVCEPVSVW